MDYQSAIIKVLADPPHLGRPECLPGLLTLKPTRLFLARTQTLSLTLARAILPPQSSSSLPHHEHPMHEPKNVPFVHRDICGTDSGNDLASDAAFVREVIVSLSC